MLWTAVFIRALGPHHRRPFRCRTRSFPFNLRHHLLGIRGRHPSCCRCRNDHRIRRRRRRRPLLLNHLPQRRHRPLRRPRSRDRPSPCNFLPHRHRIRHHPRRRHNPRRLPGRCRLRPHPRRLIGVILQSSRLKGQSSSMDTVAFIRRRARMRRYLSDARHIPSRPGYDPPSRAIRTEASWAGASSASCMAPMLSVWTDTIRWLLTTGATTCTCTPTVTRSSTSSTANGTTSPPPSTVLGGSSL